MKKISEKLPYNFQDRWKRIEDDVWEKDERPVIFEDLVRFIEKEVSIMNNPIYGKHLISKGNSRSSQPKSQRPVGIYLDMRMIILVSQRCATLV